MELTVTPRSNYIDVELKQNYTTQSINRKDNFKKEDCVPVLVLDYKSISNSEIHSDYSLYQQYESKESFIESKEIEHVLQFNMFDKDDTNSLQPNNFVQSSILNGSSIITNCYEVTSCYQGVGGLKMGSSSRNGAFGLELKYPVYKIDIEATSYGSDSSSLSVNGSKQAINKNILSWNLDDDIINITSTKRCYIKSIKFYIRQLSTTETVTYHFRAPIEKDGWITVVGLILPTRNWYINNKIIADESYKNIIYVDQGKFYKQVNGKEVEILDIGELIVPNYINTTFDKKEEDRVSILFLQNCYINLCKQSFEQRGISNCWNKNIIDNELLYKRDLAWMSINIIKYLTESNQLLEVQRIIQNVNGCNGLCTSYNSTVKSIGCGCSR